MIKSQFQSKRWFKRLIHSCQSELIPERAPKSFALFDAYRSFATHAQ